MEWKLAAHGTAPVNDGRPDGFEEKIFGTVNRLVWSHGASATVGPIAYWKRYAVMAGKGALTVVEADRAEVVEITVEHVIGATAIGVRDRELWLELPLGVLAVPLADLEQLVRNAPAEISITVSTWHPNRNAFARVPAKVVWVTGRDALVNIQEQPRVRQIRLDATTFGLEKGMQIAFVDQLWPGAYAAVDVPGRVRQTVQAPQALRIASARSERTQPRDPAAGAWESIPRTGSSIALVEQLATSPDDDVAREVLLDALADAGEPCAATFALLRARKHVSAADRDAALGPLVHFLTQIKLRHGLPARGTLVTQPPDDAHAVAAFLADLRLAMMDTVRIGRGPERLYRDVIGSPNLVGLRRADASSHWLLQELRDHRANQLTHLYSVPYTNKLAMSFLAAPAFASVRYLELVIRGSNVAKRVLNLVDELGELAAHERHIELVSPRAHDAQLIAKTLIPAFAELGLASAKIGGVTISRADKTIQVRAEDRAIQPIVDLARATFE